MLESHVLSAATEDEINVALGTSSDEAVLHWMAPRSDAVSDPQQQVWEGRSRSLATVVWGVLKETCRNQEHRSPTITGLVQLLELDRFVSTIDGDDGTLSPSVMAAAKAYLRSMPYYLPGIPMSEHEHLSSIQDMHGYITMSITHRCKPNHPASLEFVNPWRTACMLERSLGQTLPAFKSTLPRIRM